MCQVRGVPEAGYEKEAHVRRWRERGRVRIARVSHPRLVRWLSQAGLGVGRSGARTFDLVLKRVREEWKWTVLGGKLVIRSCGVEASFLGFLTR